jgi:hypothetical protein
VGHRNREARTARFHITPSVAYPTSALPRTVPLPEPSGVLRAVPGSCWTSTVVGEISNTVSLRRAGYRDCCTSYGSGTRPPAAIPGTGA